MACYGKSKRKLHQIFVNCFVQVAVIGVVHTFLWSLCEFQSGSEGEEEVRATHTDHQGWLFHPKHFCTSWEARGGPQNDCSQPPRNSGLWGGRHGLMIQTKIFICIYVQSPSFTWQLRTSSVSVCTGGDFRAIHFYFSGVQSVKIHPGSELWTNGSQSTATALSHKNTKCCHRCWEAAAVFTVFFPPVHLQPQRRQTKYQGNRLVCIFTEITCFKGSARLLSLKENIMLVVLF